MCRYLMKKKQTEICVNFVFTCLQGIRMPRSTREEQKTDSAIQKIHQPENKFTALL